MRLLDRLRTPSPEPEERAGLVQLFESWRGLNPKESLEDDFKSYVTDGYKANAIVFALIAARISLFSDAQFIFRDRKSGDTFPTGALGLLQRPWTNGTSRELLARMEQDVSLAGNAFVYRADDVTLQRLRPDWVTIVSEDGKTVAGYDYAPGGDRQQSFRIIPPDMCHWSPYPDPTANFRGMSWITPVIREVMADSQMTTHKLKFFQNAATPNLLIKYQQQLSAEQREKVKASLDLRYEGTQNAYKSMVLEGGADATVIGSTMAAISFDAIQAAGENRIASAAKVPGIVAGFKEGLQAATYSNYQQAFRTFVDMYAYPQWGSVCAALNHLVDTPGGAELWFDTSRVQALRQNELDKANLELIRAQTVAEYIRSGYEPKAILAYADDWAGLESIPHTGIVYFPGAPKDATATPEEAPDGTQPPAKPIVAQPAPVPVTAPPKPAALPAGNGKATP